MTTLLHYGLEYKIKDDKSFLDITDGLRVAAKMSDFSAVTEAVYVGSKGHLITRRQDQDNFGDTVYVRWELYNQKGPQSIAHEFLFPRDTTYFVEGRFFLHNYSLDDTFALGGRTISADVFLFVWREMIKRLGAEDSRERKFRNEEATIIPFPIREH